MRLIYQQTDETKQKNINQIEKCERTIRWAKLIRIWYSYVDRIWMVTTVGFVLRTWMDGEKIHHLNEYAVDWNRKWKNVLNKEWTKCED